MKKISKANTVKKTVSLLLSFVMILVIIPVTAAHADDGPGLAVTVLDEDQLHDIAAESVGKLPDELLQRLSLRDADIPESMSSTDIRNTEAVARLKAREDGLSSLVYVNRDGTVTEYFFFENVKYENEGNIYDKSNRLTASEKTGGYTNEENDINVTLPFELSKSSGIALSYKDHLIGFTPVNKDDGKTAAKQSSDDTVVYENAFGEGMSLEYTAQFSGVKENVIIARDTGVYEYAFVLKTHGLYLKAENGVVLLLDEKGEEIAQIGGVLIYDEKGKPGEGSFKVTELVPGEEYVYTVSVSEVFMKSDDTAFPVTVDPTVTYNSGVYNIVAVGVTNSNVSYYHVPFNIGSVSSTVTRLAVRFDNLKDTIGSYINGTDGGSQSNCKIINNVKLNITAVKNSQTPISTLVSAYAMTQYWNEVAQYNSSQSYNIYTGYDGSLVTSSTLYYMPGGMVLSFDISQMMELWMYNESDYVTSNGMPYGVLIKMNNEAESCTVYPNTVSYSRPYITINYKDCAFYSQKENENVSSNNTTWYDSYFSNKSFKTGEENGYHMFYQAMNASGCYLTSFAMMLKNLDAETTSAHTIGTLYVNQKLKADPISVVFASHEFPSIVNNVIQNTENATDAFRTRIATAFGRVSHEINPTKHNLDEKLSEHPEGVIVQLTGHYVLVLRKYDQTNKCYSDTEYIVVDPAKKTAELGFAVVLSTTQSTSSTYVKSFSDMISIIYLS